MTSDYMPPSDTSHLHRARRTLVTKLPPGHDLRKRVRHDDNGKLLPEQPSGRPRTSFEWPPARKRGREVSDPAVVLARRVLMTMWNEKYHMSEEWDRVHNKMSENRKKFGLRERPVKGSNSCKRSREGIQDTSNDEQSGGSATRLVKKKRKKRRRHTNRRRQKLRLRPGKEGTPNAGNLGFGESSISLSISI